MPTTLEHPIANGKHSVTLNMRDESDLLEKMKVAAEGVAIGPVFNSMAGQFSFIDRFGSSHTPTSFEVEVTDGKLTLQFSGQGRRKINWALDQMTIRHISDTDEVNDRALDVLRYDFGTAKSPVQEGVCRSDIQLAEPV